jgi:signal transduction histidine kinase
MSQTQADENSQAHQSDRSAAISSSSSRAVSLRHRLAKAPSPPPVVALLRQRVDGARQVSVMALQRKEGELNRDSARLMAAADRERRRLERDLHDGAQQRLVSLSVRLRLLASRLAPGSEAEQLLADARNELAAALQELSNLARGIHPAILSDRGLPAALEALTARAPLPVELLVEPGRRAPEPVELAAYYLVSEALTNILKHSHATTAGVSVARRGTRLVVEVVDDGDGGADRVTGSGLRGLTERIEALGGRLEVSSPAGAGTALRAEMPLEQGHRQAKRSPK